MTRNSKILFYRSTTTLTQPALAIEMSFKTPHDSSATMVSDLPATSVRTNFVASLNKLGSESDWETYSPEFLQEEKTR